jgi:micrococcal nuclease
VNFYPNGNYSAVTRSAGIFVLALLSIAARSAHPWVIDGDTVEYRGERIRIENLDAPEIGERSRCAQERERGYAAKRQAIQLINGGSRFEIYSRDHIDRFGRTVARLKIDGNDFGAMMIRAGVARPWRGGPSNWCN